MQLLVVAMALLLGGASSLSTDPQDEAKTWALARKVNTAAAYLAYLNRYRDGAHAEAARAAFDRVRGPVTAPHPPQPVPVPPAPPADWVDPCATLLDEGEFGAVPSPEARAYAAARRSNRPDDLAAFVARFPASVCRWRVASTLSLRRLLLPKLPGFGPLPARRITRWPIEVDDYPPAALRAEQQGRVSAAWEVSEDGEAESCRVTASSGSDVLDNATCRLVTARMRYDPARDAQGAVTRDTDHASISWRLPPDTPPPAQPK
jgi:TonB family protein